MLNAVPALYSHVSIHLQIIELSRLRILICPVKISLLVFRQPIISLETEPPGLFGPVILSRTPFVLFRTPTVLSRTSFVLSRASTVLSRTSLVLFRTPTVLFRTPTVLFRTPFILSRAPFVLFHTHTPRVVVSDAHGKPLGVRLLACYGDTRTQNFRVLGPSNSQK
jgi:hypothetical protein